MKILYFHQHFSTPSGSTGTRSYEMARRLIERGHQVTMICGSGFLAKTGLSGEPINGIRRGTVDGIEIIEICVGYSNYDSLPKRALTFLKFAFKSCVIAWKKDYDLLFATSTPLTAGIPGIVMRIVKPGRKFVFEVRDLWPELPKAMGVVKNPLVLLGMSVLEKLSYMAMHGGVALSPGIREGMAKRSSSEKKIALVPNGCDLELFRPARAEEEEMPLCLDIPQTGLRCVFTGAHGMANGLHAVLDAAEVLKAGGRKDIYLLFIGDGKLKPELKARATKDGLINCRFYDPIPKTELSRMLRHVDVGMMILDDIPAFYYGTSPNKFFDYIATGLAVLNNYPGWLAGMIKENDCGQAVPPRNPEAFAKALMDMADNPDHVKEMGRNSRALAEREFNRGKLADEFVEFLEEIGTKTAVVHREGRGGTRK
jgi:glycosyltransferase involved in cell wall biosynthesis